jgi:AcrR family transcriptional regulator
VQQSRFVTEATAIHLDERVRGAAIRVLGEHGWDGLTLERVAEASGRARSTLWRQGLSREALVEALTGALADDFRSTMYPILTVPGSGRDRLERGLGALCDVVERHLPLLLATDEAFHQAAPGGPASYLDPFVHFLREGEQDGSLPLAPDVDPTDAADLAFNAVAWTYAHLRGKHGWAAEKARARVVGLVLDGIADSNTKEDR